jgi:hypothetical protein
MEQQLQSDEAKVEEVQTTEASQNSESAPETQAEDNSNVQRRINKITAEKYALQRENEELKKGLKPSQDSAQAPVAPEVDSSTIAPPAPPSDMFDEDAVKKYNAEVVEYSAKVAREAAENSAKSVYEKQQEQARQAAHQESTQKMVQSYAEKGLQAGLTQEQMYQNEQVLNGSGISADLGLFIMNDDAGAQIADYLASNPEELHVINAMTPTQAAVKIANEIKPKATGPSNVTSAPDPVAGISGGQGARETDDFTKACPNASFD